MTKEIGTVSAALVLVVVGSFPSAVTAKPRVTWSVVDGATLGHHKRCHVLYGDSDRTTKAEAGLLFSSWLLVEPRCDGPGPLVVQFSRLSDDSLAASLTFKQSEFDEVRGDRENFTAIANRLSKTFRRDFSLSLVDPGRSGTAESFAWTVVGHPGASAETIAGVGKAPSRRVSEGNVKASGPSPAPEPVKVVQPQANVGSPLATAAASPPPPSVNKGPDLPPDGQVLRDTLPYIVRVARLAALPVNPKKFVITKEIDSYEKDECNATVQWSKQGVRPWTVTAVYQRNGDFWKLRTLSN
jgi:hypothetical protein